MVIGYNTGAQAVRTALAGTELTLEFQDAGSFGGLSGCNTYSGDYETTGEYGVVAGQTFSVGELAATEIACLEPDGVMEQEIRFLEAMANSDLWRLVGANLELRDAAGALQISAVPAG